MLNNNTFKNNNTYIIALMFIGVLLRLLFIDVFPTGLNQDEAYVGYEAMCILNNGTDSFGNIYPVYLGSWGSGMASLSTYVTAFLFNIFGESVFVLRVSHSILNIVSLYVVYLILNEIFNKNTATLGLFLIVISPWHISSARWAVDINYAIYFAIFGFYFFIKGIKNNKLWLVSALMYGLSLHCYATMYIVVPLTLFMFVVYILLSRQKFNFKYAITSCIILFVLALPLILSMIINYGYMQEIRTPYFSIIKQISFRGGEVKFNNLFSPQAYINLFKMIFLQHDGLLFNSSRAFGMFYMINTPFIIVGFIKLIKNIYNDIQENIFSYNIFILLGIIASFITGLIASSPNITRTNTLHIYTLMLITLGLQVLLKFINNKKINYAIISVYLCHLILYTGYYVTDYNDQLKGWFRAGVYESVELVNTLDAQEVCVDESVFFPQVLFADKTDTQSFIDTVQWKNYPSPYLNAQSFTKYNFYIDYSNIDISNVYIAHNNNYDIFKEKGFDINIYENYLVAY